MSTGRTPRSHRNLAHHPADRSLLIGLYLPPLPRMLTIVGISFRCRRRTGLPWRVGVVLTPQEPVGVGRGRPRAPRLLRSRSGSFRTTIVGASEMSRPPPWTHRYPRASCIPPHRRLPYAHADVYDSGSAFSCRRAVVREVIEGLTAPCCRPEDTEEYPQGEGVRAPQEKRAAGHEPRRPLPNLAATTRSRRPRPRLRWAQDPC